MHFTIYTAVTIVNYWRMQTQDTILDLDSLLLNCPKRKGKNKPVLPETHHSLVSKHVTDS